MGTGSTLDAIAVSGEVLSVWKTSVETRNADAAAEVFTSQALFQGLSPNHIIGREAIHAYYCVQPDGLTADFTILSARALTSRWIVAFAEVQFRIGDALERPVKLTIVLERCDRAWLIAHYHVADLPA